VLLPRPWHTKPFRVPKSESSEVWDNSLSEAIQKTPRSPPLPERATSKSGNELPRRLLVTCWCLIITCHGVKAGVRRYPLYSGVYCYALRGDHSDKITIFFFFVA
jgi:hypothetical protein